MSEESNELPPESDAPNSNRRRLLIGAGASPLVVMLANKPAFATFSNCSINGSATASGGLTSNDGDTWDHGWDYDKKYSKYGSKDYDKSGSEDYAAYGDSKHGKWGDGKWGDGKCQSSDKDWWFKS